MSSGDWLEKTLQELCGKMETGLDLDADLISGLVSFCELAPPPDAADYLSNIIGLEASQNIIKEYLQKRGYTDSSTSSQTSNFQAYVKPPADENGLHAITTKKQARTTKEANILVTRETKSQTENAESRNTSKGSSSGTKKKKAGKVISLAEAAKGSVVFQQGKPCSCQARRHKLVSNCLSCGKIVCEQEGEGPCSFCGALVLREGSTYAGLDDLSAPTSDAEAAADAFAKRLVDYDRNSAARTTVIDDQSDYYEIEGNSWLSGEEKSLLRKKQKEIEEAATLQRKKVIVTFDLVGRKVLVDKDDASELDSAILRPTEEREQNRIKPNPTIPEQPIFVNTGLARHPANRKQQPRGKNGLCLEISGRVQHDNELPRLVADSQRYGSSSAAGLCQDSQIDPSRDEDAPECSLDYN